MLAHLGAKEIIAHHVTTGTATEHGWLRLLNRYLPRRYRATPAFIMDAEGRRSRQIDIAIYDNFYSPLLFPHESAMHIPAESVYAVFEVKQAITRAYMLDAARKAASVRALHRTSAEKAARPKDILAGILAVGTNWPKHYGEHVAEILRRLKSHSRLDLGIALRHGAFELDSGDVYLSTADEALVFFMLRLLERLRSLGPPPALDLMRYGQSLSSFSHRHKPAA